MSRLAYIFYIYIKANTHHTPSKISKAIEEIQRVQKNLPLHLSHKFPANDDDKQWEAEHPWVSFQRYLITLVLDFLQLGITRVIISKEPQDDTAKFRKLALESSSRILHNYATVVPRYYKLVWTVSAAVVAAAMYLALDMLTNPHDYHGDTRSRMIELLRNSTVELKSHAAVAVHAAKGSSVMDSLLPVLEKPDTSLLNSPHSVPDLLRQLSASNHDLGPNRSDLFNANSPSEFPHTQEDFMMFAGAEEFLEEPFRTDDWNEFLVDI